MTLDNNPTEDTSQADGQPVTATDAQDEAQAQGEGQTALEQELKRREALCSEAESVAGEKDWRRGPSDFRRLADEWRSLRRWHDPREDELQRRFDAAREAFYTARDAAREEASKKKEALAAEAERLSKSDRWKATGDRFRELMDEWKAAGTAGHEVDEELWQRFNKARRSFYDAREEHFKQLDAARAEAKAKKEALVERAREAAKTSEDWKGAEWRAASARMKELMDEWKAAGVAERADNDRLWKEFTDARQPFFDAQHAHYNKVEADQKEAAQAKQALVDEARELCEGSDFSREATERAKDLDRRWRKIGYAGKELNDRLWEDFNKAKEGFWDKKRAYGEERHEEWRQRTEDAIERREKRIANLKQQTEHLRERIANAYATDHVEEMQERLDDKLDLIKQIEDEVKDIKSRLDD